MNFPQIIGRTVASGRGTSVLMAALLLAGCSCGEAPAVLIVNLQTNLRAGFEFDRAVVSLYPGATAAALDVPNETAPAHPVTRSSPVFTGERLAEFSALAHGPWLAQAELMLGDRAVGTGIVAFDWRGRSTSVTVRVWRECEGVACPGDGSLTNIACLGGHCVDPRCSPEAPEFCPPPECEGDAECSPNAEPACAVGVCVTGVCASALDDALCAGGVCLPAGCKALPPDAGGSDAGGFDAGGSDADAGVGIDVIGVAGGHDHTCAVTATGEVYCWGANFGGALGDGTRSSRTRPAPVTGLTDAVQVVSALGYSCARRATGGVVCWGENGSGQLGDGTTAARMTPVAVEGLTDARQIAATYQHTCAVRRGGEVWCWGWNGDGQLGVPRGAETGAPAVVMGVSDAVHVGTGQFWTCALRTTGAVLCWGGNREGQLGDGTFDSDPTPHPALDLADAIVLAVGVSASCAIDGGGAVHCWGHNGRGQLGDGTTVHRPRPTATGVTNAVAIGGGWTHTCALLETGEVSCWGADEGGQLGDSMVSELRSTPGLVADLSDATAIGVGHFHGCALRPLGALVCWGKNEFGQLGSDPTTTYRAVPGAVRF